MGVFRLRQHGNNYLFRLFWRLCRQNNRNKPFLPQYGDVCLFRLMLRRSRDIKQI